MPNASLEAASAHGAIDEDGVVDDLDENDCFDNAVRTAVERGAPRAFLASGGDYFKSRQAAMAELMGVHGLPRTDGRRAGVPLVASGFLLRVSSLELHAAVVSNGLFMKLLVQGKEIHETPLTCPAEVRRGATIPFSWDPPLEFVCQPDSSATDKPIVFILCAQPGGNSQSRAIGYGSVHLSPLSAELVNASVQINRPGPNLRVSAPSTLLVGTVVCSVLPLALAGQSKVGGLLSAGFQRPVSASSRQSLSSAHQRPSSAATVRSVPAGWSHPLSTGPRSAAKERPFSASSARGSSIVGGSASFRHSTSSFMGLHNGAGLSSSLAASAWVSEAVRTNLKNTPCGFQYQVSSARASSAS